MILGKCHNKMEQQDTRNEVAKNSMIKHFPVVGKVKKNISVG